jgi:hypothetical protein
MIPNQQFNLVEDDILELIELCNDKKFGVLALNNPESWAGMHSMRARSQLGGELAIASIISSFNEQGSDASVRNE